MLVYPSRDGGTLAKFVEQTVVGLRKEGANMDRKKVIQGFWTTLFAVALCPLLKISLFGSYVFGGIVFVLTFCGFVFSCTNVICQAIEDINKNSQKS